MTRQLATVQKITSLKPIDGADKIEVAKILGWNVIVKKETFKVNDLVIFVEIDSILPERPEFEFLRERNFRIKTIKLRKQVSQGICFPLSILPESASEMVEGSDVTELLGITKHDPIANMPPQLRGQIKGLFPKCVPKTDEIRIQSAPSVIEELKGRPYYITLKIDGTSFTFLKKDGEVDVCSRNLSLKETQENLYWQIVKKYDLENKIPEGYAIQGEIAGPGIQSNRMKLKQCQLFIFNVYNIHENRYLNYLESERFLSSTFPYEVSVPTLVQSSYFNYTLDELIESAKGEYPGGHPREGIVVRPMEEVYSETLRGRLSFKVINNDYLLKIGE